MPRDELVNEAPSKAGESSHERISAVEPSVEKPLNPAQERLWFLHQAYPHQALFPLLAGYRIVGAAARTCRLLQALSKVQERRDALRSRFLRIDEEPARMEVLARSSLPATVVDLRSLGADQRVLEAERLERREAEHSLGGGPLDLLWRATVILPEPDELVLLLTLSPAIASRTTVAALVEEVALELEGAIRNGGSPSRSAKAEASPSEAPQEGLDTYLESLASSPPEPNLSVDWLRPPVQSLCAGEVSLPLARTFPEETLLASFLGFLVRVTDPGRLLRPIRMALGVGTTHAQSETLLPFFLVVEGDPSFASLVADGAAALKRRRGLQGLTFEGMLERLQPPRDPSRAPLFQLGFRIESSLPFPPVPGLEVERFPRPEITTELDLELRSGQAEDVPYLKAVFSRDLFEATTVARLLSSLRVFMEAGHQKPALRLSELPLLSKLEEEQLVRVGNRPPSSALGGGSIHEAFFRQAKRTPAAVAVTAAGVDVTYQELARRATLLAEGLQGLGIAGGDTVGVLCCRSPSLIASLLGVLRAGAAYVPLDPAYPEERLRFMLQDSEAKALVTDSPLAERLSGDGKGTAGVPLLRLNGEGCWESVATNNKAWRQPSPDELAYVIYTSGSTGRPKGVAIPHNAATALVTWARGVFSDRELSGVLGATSVCFDLSVFEIFVPLSCGGRIVLVQDLLRLPEEAASQGVTLINTVPSVLGELLQAHSLPETVETVNLAGEPLLAPLVAEAYRQPGVRRVLNLYGPSEDTTYSTWAEIAVREEAPSIGRPVAGSAAYVVDARLRPLPAGVGGELILGGDGLARGYLGRPALTAECFVPNPFSNGRGARLYRTGDRARLRPNEDLQFLGRLDRQVKLRGFRIELGEVEATMTRCPGVAQAAVVVRLGLGDLAEMVAYVGTSIPDEVKAGDLRQWLEEKMPAHMVPATFVILPELPLTPSGKIDRGALPRAASVASGRQARREVELTERRSAKSEAGRSGPRQTSAPRNEVEAIVAGLVGEILGLADVDRDDDFFNLGGHSLLAARLAAAVRDTFGVTLSMGTVFSTPRVQALAAAVATLRGGVGGGQAVERPMPRLADRSRLPLTFAQEQLWLFEQANPGTAVYNVPAGLRLCGALNLTALREALDGVVQRHEILHSRLFTDEGRAFSRPEDGRRALREAGTWPLVDLTVVAARCRESLRTSLERRATARPVDPAAGRPLRGWILRVAPGEHDLLLSFHHSAVDGVSLEIFFWELGALYGAALRGEDALTLPPLEVQVGDVAAWQRAHLTPPRRAVELDFWRSQLADLPAALELPTDRPRRPLPSYRGLRLPVRLPAELVEGLQTLGRRRGATLFMVLLAAFQALLARLSGQRSLTVGIPSAYRPRREMENLVGYFVSVLVLPARMAADTPFEDLLRQVRGTALDVLSHPDLPFQDLVEELGVGGDRSRNPLFQVLFQLVPAPAPARLEELEVTSLERENGTAKFDLELSLEQEEKQGKGGTVVRGYLEASADLFDGSTVERWLGHWRRLLEAVVAGPETVVGELQILSAAEQRQLKVWSEGQRALEGPTTAHAFFEEQAQLTPSALAVIVAGEGAGEAVGGREMTYLELESRSAALAARLQTLGVGPDVAVGLAVERSPLAMVGVLGILRAGGCYVPLDPAYPRLRLETMLADAGIDVLVTQGGLLEGLPEREELAVVLLDRDLDALKGGPRSQSRLVPVAVRGDNLAYVIFTSGSTGRPKGVALSHGALANLVAWQRSESTPQPSLRTLQFASLSFDVSFQEMFSTWATGGAVVLVSEELRRDPARLLVAMTQVAVDRIFLPFVALESLAQEAMEGRERGEGTKLKLREIITAGEQLRMTPALVAWLGALGDCRLHNQYGPSETHVTTAWTLEVDTRQAPALPPIGKPVANHRSFVLDAQLRRAPCGVVGELLLGGVGLARGYLGRPSLTAERFVPDSCSGDSGSRLYRTGDRARWLPSGDLEFLGRLDEQVKVRGYRVEPGEIETVLAEQPGVAEAVAVVREDRPGVNRLVAYLVPAGETVNQDLLRQGLRGRLPEFMVPSAFVMLPFLPLTPSGKVDRRRLPAPDAAKGRSTQPKTALERALARIWTEVLPVQEIGPEDHFFELGGHSLVAARVTARVRQRFGFDLPVKALFDHPVLRDLAAHLEAKTPPGPVAEPVSGEQGLEQVPGTLEGTSTRAPLSWAQKRFFFLDRLEPGSPHYVLPSAFEILGRLEPAVLCRAVRNVVYRHEILRTVYGLEQGEPVQTVVPYGEVRLDLPVVDLSSVGSANIGHWTSLARTGAARSFELSMVPLLRTTLFRLGQDHHIFALDVHHVACDGWGLGVLFDEISASYSSSSWAGAEQRLPPVPLQYSAYAAWEQGRDRSNEAAILAFWRDHLAGAPQVLELPLDRPRAAFAGHRGRALEVVLPAALTRDLRKLARNADASLFMVVLAAFGWLLKQLSGQADLLLAVPVANRRRPELEGLIGCFMNVVVPRLAMDGRFSGAETLERVRETTLAALQHSELPLERVLEDLKPRRQDGRNPLFQVLFQVLNTPSSPLLLGGVRGVPRLVDNGTSRVDLELTLVEEGEALTAIFEYDRDLFDATSVLRWSHHLEALLVQIVADPQRPLDLFVLASAAERHQVMREWNDTEEPLPPRLLHELFEAQVARTPDAIAFVDRDRSLTYAQLNAKANRLARLLLSLGIEPGDPVAVLVDRTGLLPVSLMGILKAGAFYIPLDLTYPEERIVFMLEDACGGDSSALVLVDDSLRDDIGIVPDFARIQYINLGDPNQDQGEDPGNPALPGNLRQTVYLLYTSGSTGRPKGVQIPHGAVVNFVEAMTRWPGIGLEDMMLAVITAAFDMSVTEIFWPLSRGARVVIAERAVASDGLRLAAALEESGATVLQATPATWHLLVQAGWQGDGRLKIITGGEALTQDLSRHLLAAVGEVWNLYGPTETTVFCGGIHYVGGPITVGRSFINTATHVLDRDLREAPMGVPGEAYISGACLATGYFGRPALTAERFVPDPYSSWGSGRRMYRSGDVARWRPDGRLEILGRTDFQVKIRGFRIELEEIETVLADHPAVTQAAVLAREDRPGDRRLVAYLLLAPGQGQPSVGGLQTYLSKSLPGYMVPSSYVVLDAMPLTPNEKLDRQALPAPEGRALGREDDGVAPRTPTEAWVAEIFAELVGAERVGPFDDFFALGGHSLLALHVITRVREKGGVDLPLATLFRASTVEKLAAVIDGEVGISSSAAVLLGASATERPPFFCCHGVGGNVFRMMPLALEVARDRAFYGLQGWADLHDVDHMSSVEQMAARYVAEMRQVQPRGPYYLGGHSLGCIVAFEIARLLTGEGHEVAFLGLLDGPANPGKAAPSKAALRSFNHEAHLALELGVEIDRRAFDRISKEKRLEIVVEKGIASNALPAGFTAVDARRYLEVYRITQEAWMRYRPASWGGRATFFSTKSANPRVRALDPTDGWGEAALGGVEVINVPGDHNTMLRRPHVETLAAELLRVMKEAEKAPMSFVEVPAKRGFGILLSKLGLRRRGSGRRS